MMEKPKLSSRTLINLILIVILLVAIPVYIILVRKPAVSPTAGRLIFDDYAQAHISITDANGKSLAKTSYPHNNRTYYQATSASGKVLLALNVNLPNESFQLLDGNKLSGLPSKLSAALSTSVLIGQSHSIFFADNANLVTLACSGQQNCQLLKLSLHDGSVKQTVNTGIKLTTPQFPQVFLAGYSEASNTAYIRTMSDNSLGQTKSGLYAVSLETKKTSLKAKIPESAGYAVSVSPDESTVAYQTTDKGQTNIHIIKLSDASEQKVSLKIGMLANSPSTLIWSPDSKKILIHNQAVNRPASENAVTQSIQTVYIDLADNNKVVGLQEIKDTQYGNLVNEGWLDNNTVISQVQKTKQARNFINAESLTATQDTGSKKIKTFKAPGGNLEYIYQVKS